MAPKKRKAGVPDETAKRQDRKLDLDVSYVGRVEIEPAPPRPPPPPKWTYAGPGPLNDPRKLPKGWHDREPDIDAEDYDALIQRCHERIQDNIMPHIFEHRRKGYEELKAQKDKMMAAKPGLSWEVVQRLDCLDGIEDWLKDQQDDVKLLSTVAAIKRAYESGELRWNEGLVTYWSHGEQKSQPRPFDWEEFSQINKMFNGHEGFWVEGLHGYTSASISAVQENRTVSRKKPHILQSVDVSFRLSDQHVSDGVPAPVPASLSLPCMDDTGSEFLCVSHDDILILRTHTDAQLGCVAPYQNPPPPLVGVLLVRLANGARDFTAIRQIEVSMMDSNNQPMLPSYDKVQACVFRGPGVRRLIGPWLRGRLFTASAPDGTCRTWIFNQKGSINLKLPNPRYEDGSVPVRQSVSLADYQSNTGHLWPGHPNPLPGEP